MNYTVEDLEHSLQQEGLELGQLTSSPPVFHMERSAWSNNDELRAGSRIYLEVEVMQRDKPIVRWGSFCGPLYEKRMVPLLKAPKPRKTKKR